MSHVSPQFKKRKGVVGELQRIKGWHKLTNNLFPNTERTLNLLYSAQQQNRQRESIPAPLLASLPPRQIDAGSAVVSPTDDVGQNQSQQQSLHRFWNIGSAPSSTASAPPRLVPMPSSCDDCGAELDGPEGFRGQGGVEMDDGSASSRQSCVACGKNVCFSCSVSNLGENKRCLRCAGRGVGGGGPGWNDDGMVLC